MDVLPMVMDVERRLVAGRFQGPPVRWRGRDQGYLTTMLAACRACGRNWLFSYDYPDRPPMQATAEVIAPGIARLYSKRTLDNFIALVSDEPRSKYLSTPLKQYLRELLKGGTDPNAILGKENLPNARLAAIERFLKSTA